MADIAVQTPAAGAKSYSNAAYRNYVLITLTLVYTLNFIDRTLLAVVAQPVINAFSLTDSQYGFLGGPPFAIFYALMGIPLAMAADRYNRVVIIALCIALWSLMAALCGFATSFLFLLIARVGVAVGEAGCTPPANSIIADYFKPVSRANALGIYAMGVTLGGALANLFGGPIATGLTGANMELWLQSMNLSGFFSGVDWAHIEGWRLAFILIGAPGLIIALIVLFTVKEPPRGYSDPPGRQHAQKASITETLAELASKPSFWTMAVGASLTALVGYGLAGFQAPMAQRVHGINPGQFALEFGVPLALCAASGTFLAGFIIEKLTPRFPTAVAWVPAVGLTLCVPLYEIAYFMPTEQIGLARILWCVGAALHYSYLGSQYTIGQGVVSARSRASAIAMLLLMVALIGNGLGPWVVGALSDMMMHQQLAAHGAAELTMDACRTGLAQLSDANKEVCRLAYGEGLRNSMAATALIFIPAAAFFLMAAFTYKKDCVAKA